MGEGLRKKFITIRATEEEERKLLALVAESTCRSVSEYARLILFKYPVTFYTRNKSADETLEVLIALQKDLNGIANNFNQAVKKLHQSGTLEDIILWAKLYEKLSQSVEQRTEHIRMEMIKIREYGNENKNAQKSGRSGKI